MHYKRGLASACAHKGLIYVCGGFDGQNRLASLEVRLKKPFVDRSITAHLLARVCFLMQVYHPAINEWRLLDDMSTAREGAGLVVADDALYCLGGYDGMTLLKSMEK